MDKNELRQLAQRFISIQDGITEYENWCTPQETAQGVLEEFLDWVDSTGPDLEALPPKHWGNVPVSF